MYQEIIFGLLLFFAAIQLFYHVYYFLAIAFNKETFDIKIHRPVSVIVCAHNELENLQKLIPAILQQNYHLFELIVINDRSFDGTYEYLEELKKTESKLKVVTADENRSNMDAKKYALTLGIKAASHEHLLLTDADCIPNNKNWILQMQSKFTENIEFVLGISQYEKGKGFLNAIIRAETFYTAIQYISFAIRKNTYMGIGRNIAYKKSVFLENKGFHPFMYITGGDDDLFVNKQANKYNCTVSVSFDSQTTSLPKLTWKEWITQKKRHLSVSRYYSSKSKFELIMLNFSHLGVSFSVILLAFSELYYNFGLLIFLARWLILILTYNIAIKKMRYNIAIWQLLVFDFIYPFYYIFVGLQSLRNKNIKWK
ncbi:MAG: glycosyltransferase [Cytophagales bacterium]